MQLEVVASDASRERRTVALRSSYIHLGPMPDSHNAVRRSHPSPHVPRRLHPVCGGLAGGPVDRPSPPTELFDEGSEVTVSFAPEHCVLL